MSNITQNWVATLIPFCSDYSRRMTASMVSRELKMSQQTVNRAMNSLVKRNLLSYKNEGRNKMFFINRGTLNSSILVQLIENQKAILFSLGNPKIATIIQDLKRYCESIIVFGSYASGRFNKDLDLDLVVFSADKKKFEKEKEKFPLEINCHFVSYSEFCKLLKNKNALALEILSNHILIGNVSKLTEVFYE